MAQVTMDISELDKLRDDLKKKQEHIKGIEKELMEVRADKRVLKVSTTKIPSKNDFTYSFNAERYYDNRRRYGYTTTDSDLIKECISIYPILHHNSETKEFVNFEDVRKELQEKLEKEYAEEISELKYIKKTLNEKIRDKELEYKDRERRLIKEHEEYGQLLIAEKDEWIKKYKELEDGKKELTKIEQLEKELEERKEDIKILGEMLKKEQAKKWWHKIFG